VRLSAGEEVRHQLPSEREGSPSIGEHKEHRRGFGEDVARGQRCCALAALPHGDGVAQRHPPVALGDVRPRVDEVVRVKNHRVIATIARAIASSSLASAAAISANSPS
jgi:hypothetical protein